MTIYEPLDKRRWRVGKSYGIHIYADIEGSEANGESLPIASAFTTASATQIVNEHNYILTQHDIADLSKAEWHLMHTIQDLFNDYGSIEVGKVVKAMIFQMKNDSIEKETNDG